MTERISMRFPVKGSGAVQNDEVIADFTGFLTTVGQSLIAGLIDARNERLLNGAQALTTATGIQVHAVGADTKLDALFLAGNLLRTGSSFTEPDTIILNPADYGDVRLIKDAEGRYLTGDPAAAGPPTIFGTRVLVTNKIAAGTGLVANLQEAARLYVREAPRVDVNPMGGAAEFIANQTLLRAEERLALAIVKPTAVVKVTGL
ncbi:MAG: phage major capsid protein [Actinobacteria bacterium]|nr:phage major capsid protein [Actinomycetota bacterium]